MAITFDPEGRLRRFLVIQKEEIELFSDHTCLEVGQYLGNKLLPVKVAVLFVFFA
jgi:hypothetical protein